MYLFNHHPCSGLRLENSLFFARSSFLMLGRNLSPPLSVSRSRQVSQPWPQVLRLTARSGCSLHQTSLHSDKTHMCHDTMTRLSGHDRSIMSSSRIDWHFVLDKVQFRTGLYLRYEHFALFCWSSSHQRKMTILETKQSVHTLECVLQTKGGVVVPKEIEPSLSFGLWN